jgi:hypothetical protein
MIMYTFNTYSRPLRYTDDSTLYGPATAQEALSQFQSSAIETITLTVLTLVKTSKRKHYRRFNSRKVEKYKGGEMRVKG